MMLQRFSLKNFIALFLIGLLVSCATTNNSAVLIEKLLATHEIKATHIEGTQFTHLALWHGELKKAKRINVYLEGDGLPWVTRHQIATDPTPRDPLALKLMLRDPQPALYLGRPCYFGFAHTSPCASWWWTDGRYSPEVIASLRAALEHLIPSLLRSDPRVTLIGYSGGGVLAILLAATLPRVDTVITIAANLDILAWADYHGYRRLTGSLNPAQLPPLAANIQQLHFIGAQDTQVPFATTKKFWQRNPQARLRILPEFNHHCCWIEHWLELKQILLQEI